MLGELLSDLNAQIAASEVTDPMGRQLLQLIVYTVTNCIWWCWILGTSKVLAFEQRGL